MNLKDVCVCGEKQDGLGVRMSLPMPHQVEYLELVKADYIASKRNSDTVSELMKVFVKTVETSDQAGHSVLSVCQCLTQSGGLIQVGCKSSARYRLEHGTLQSDTSPSVCSSVFADT